MRGPHRHGGDAGLLGFDRRARNASALPTSGTLLGIESWVRRVYTIPRRNGLPSTRNLYPPPRRVQDPHPGCQGHPYEWYHGRFQMAVSISANMFLVAGQDTKAHAVVGTASSGCTTGR